MKVLPVLLKDFYKTGHKPQYPDGTQVIYSNLTPRGSRIPEIDWVVVFGIQYFLKEYLLRMFNEEFFSIPRAKVMDHYKMRMDTSLGKDAFNMDHIGALHDVGYIPLKIKALAEGTRCPMRVPVMTLKNTIHDFFWVTNMFETILSNTIWGPMTSATIADRYRQMLDGYAKATSDMPEFAQWQGHDFSMRGMYGLEAALMSGAAHLLSFTGTDTIPAIDFLETYYGADATKELIGGSVPATEHSVMCMGGDEGEFETYERLLTKIYPKGIVSVVSDTWDYWKVLTDTLPKLVSVILGRDGKLVIRPDSGDPVKIICGDSSANPLTPEYKGSIEILWDIFGGHINSKGFKQLNPHIGLIYGDSITLERCKAICEGLKKKGFASTNVVFGMGSYTYQHVTRDTFGFAMKATYGIINGKPVEIFKTPKTDSGIKNSARGLLRVNEDLTLSERVTPEEEETGLLETVFLDGKITKEYTLKEIREKLSTGR